MSFVQDHSNSTTGAGTTIADTITGVTASNLLRVVVAWIDLVGPKRTITISDGGNSYTAAFTSFWDSSNSGFGVQEFYIIAPTGGSYAITATFSANTTDQHIYIQERASCAGLNAVGTVPPSVVPGASGANAVVGQAVTTTSAADVCAFTINTTGTGSTLAAGTTLPWVGRTGHRWSTPGGSGAMFSEDLVNQSAASYIPTFGISASGDRYIAYAIAYTGPPPAGPLPQRIWLMG